MRGGGVCQIVGAIEYVSVTLQNALEDGLIASVLMDRSREGRAPGIVSCDIYAIAGDSREATSKTSNSNLSAGVRGVGWI